MLGSRMILSGAAAAMLTVGASVSQAALLAYFPFENSVSSSAGTVSIGAPYVNGTPSYTAGQSSFGQALDSPGAGAIFIQHPTAGTAISLLGSSYTISAQVKIDSAANPKFRIFATDDGTAAGVNGWGLRTNGAGNLLWRHGSNEVEIPVEGSLGMTPGQWYNIVLYYDATAAKRLFIVNNTIRHELSGVPANAVTYDQNLRFLNYQDLPAAQGFDGAVDDVRIYDTALTLTRSGGTITGGEVFHLFDAPVPEPSMLGLVAMGLAAMARRRAVVS